MRRKRPSRLRDDLSRKGIKHKKNIREGSGARAPGPFFVNKTFSVIFSGRWYNNCGKRNSDRLVGPPRFAGIIPAAHGLRSKCRFAALPSLRTWYNNCGRHSSDRPVGPPRFAGIIPAAHGLRSKCRFAALPSLRTWYNNCGRHSSDRPVGPPRFAGIIYIL